MVDNSTDYMSPLVRVYSKSGKPLVGRFKGDGAAYGPKEIEYEAQVTDFKFKHKDESYNECDISIETNDVEYFDIPVLKTGMPVIIQYGYIQGDQKTIRFVIADKKLSLSSDGFVIKIRLVDEAYYRKSKTNSRNIGSITEIIDELEVNGYETVIQYDGEQVYNSEQFINNSALDIKVRTNQLATGSIGEGVVLPKPPQPHLTNELVLMYRMTKKEVTVDNTLEYLKGSADSKKVFTDSELEDAYNMIQAKAFQRHITRVYADVTEPDIGDKIVLYNENINLRPQVSTPDRNGDGTLDYVGKKIIYSVPFSNKTISVVADKVNAGKKLIGDEQAIWDDLNELTPTVRESIIAKSYNDNESKDINLNYTNLVPDSNVGYYSEDGEDLNYRPFTDALKGATATEKIFATMEKQLKRLIERGDLIGAQKLAAERDLLLAKNELMLSANGSSINSLIDAIEQTSGEPKVVSIDGNRVTIHNRSTSINSVSKYRFLTDDRVISLDLREDNIISEMKADIFNNIDPDSKTTVKGMTVSNLSGGKKGIYDLDDARGPIVKYIHEMNQIIKSGKTGNRDFILPNLVVYANQWNMDILNKQRNVQIPQLDKRWDDTKQMYRYIIPAKVAMNLPYVKFIADNIAKNRATEIEQNRVTIEMVIVGDVNIAAADCVDITGIPSRFEGKWYVKDVEHSITVNDGYKTTLNLMILPQNVDFFKYGISNSTSMGITKEDQKRFMKGLKVIDIIEDYIRTDEDGIIPEYDNRVRSQNLTKMEHVQATEKAQYGIKGTQHQPNYTQGFTNKDQLNQATQGRAMITQVKLGDESMYDIQNSIVTYGDSNVKVDKKTVKNTK